MRRTVLGGDRLGVELFSGSVVLCSELRSMVLVWAAERGALEGWPPLKSLSS